MRQALAPLLRRLRGARPPAADLGQLVMQLRLAEAIGWIVDRADAVDGALSVSGWALSPLVPASAMRFLLNGAPFAELAWPLPSPDVAAYFPDLPFAVACRVRARQKFASAEPVFPDGYACLEFATPAAPHPRSYRHAVYLLNPALEPPVPDLPRIARVIAPDAASYRIGGATLARRLDCYLTERFARPLARFSDVLDWGCGAGRLTRHLVRLCRGAVTGLDIDPDNIGWCAASLPGARFAVGPLYPPLDCADGAFDLAIAISVFTHLDEPTQFRWLAELRRVVRPGGLVLASVQGLAQMAFYRVTTQYLVDVQTRGFLLSGRNDQLDAVIANRDYYKNAAHAHDYIWRRWSEYFEVCDIVEGLATNQDLVALRRRE
jgi:SAM-dependent methyltransferase